VHYVGNRVPFGRHLHIVLQMDMTLIIVYFTGGKSKSDTVPSLIDIKFLIMILSYFRFFPPIDRASLSKSDGVGVLCPS
jgi:hypothetical protein